MWKCWNLVHPYNGWETSLHVIHFRSVATWYKVCGLSFFSMVECFHSTSRGIDNSEARAHQSTNSKSSSMDGTSLRSCVCCCHANLVAWSSFIFIKEDSKLSPLAVLSDCKCWLTKSWSCRNSLPVPVFDGRRFNYGLHVLLVDESWHIVPLLNTFIASR